MRSLYTQAGWRELDGARVCVAAFEALGQGGDRRALLLHGNPANLDHFRAIVPALRRRAAVIAHDHPGFGRSGDFTHGEVSLERSARLALAVLDSLQITAPVDLIGHSHGGMVAVALASIAPERVRSLVLLGTGGTPTHGSYRLLSGIPGLARLLPALAAPLYRAPRLRHLARKVTALGAHASFSPDEIPPSFLDEEMAELQAHPGILRAMVRLSLDEPCAKAAAHARRVRAPVLVIHGVRDALVAISYARRLFAILREAAPVARFVEVSGGHMGLLTHPERTAPLLDAWLAG